MQFKVPQFLDIEDKLFGPFTFKEFVYLAGGAGMIFVLYKLLPLWIAIIPIAAVALLSGLLTFYRINNKPFIYYLQAGVNYAISSKLFVWKQRLVKHNDKQPEENIQIQTTTIVPVVSESKLKDLSWSLDIENNADKK